MSDSRPENDFMSTETLVTTGRMDEAESGSAVRLHPVVRRRQSFIDCLTETGWRRGSIAWPVEDAIIVAAGFREEHPNWLVEINPIEGTP
jgi:hypothetical protein